MYLFFDTETTGFFYRDRPLTDPAQPHLCQLGAILTDATGATQAELNMLVRPDGWIIPEGAQRVHGISQQHAAKYGVEESQVVRLFRDLCFLADLLVAHNFAFDDSILDIAYARYEITKQPRSSYCTMKESTPLCKIPSARGGYKWPKCTEAYKHFFGVEFDGAHDAMADVRACKDIFFAIKNYSPSP